MANYKTDIAWSPNTGVQRQEDEPSGIMGTAPSSTTPETEEQGFLERMYEQISNYFYDEDEAVEFFDNPPPVTSSELPNSDWSTLKPVEEVTSSVGVGSVGPVFRIPPRPDTRSNVPLDAGDDPEVMEDTPAQPESGARDSLPDVDTEETEAPTGAGLMSRDRIAENLPFSMGTTTSTEDPAILRESQERLKSAGYYRTSVDGVGGRSTTNAVKTFQYENGLDVTGELDEQTRTKLASTDIDARPEISDADNELLSFIGKGESGGYGAANDYGGGRTQWGVMDSYFSERKGKPIDKLTVAEIRDIQSGGFGNREVFAVGAYQLIPDTFNEAIAALDIPDDAVFDSELQDRIALEYLAADKRPKLRDWLDGSPMEVDANGRTPREQAMMAFAKEWASIPVPYDITRKGVLIRRGESYYKPEGNTANAHTAEETEALLDSLRPARTEEAN